MRILASAAALYILLLSSNVHAEAKAPAADNSAQNKGAEQRDAVTADKQAMDNKKSDVKVLAAVRKSIVDEKDLSMNAKNCKLRFMKDGCLILRGPVDSEAEKAKIAELAGACAGVTKVQNELTIAPKSH